MIDINLPPNVRIGFRAGSYEQAIIDHETAKQWLLDNGLAFDRRIVGIVRSPTFNGETPPPIMDAANGWLDKTAQTGWQVTIEMWSEDTRRLLDIAGFDMPVNAFQRHVDSEGIK